MENVLCITDVNLGFLVNLLSRFVSFVDCGESADLSPTGMHPPAVFVCVH